jgi:hypothetical protein
MKFYSIKYVETTVRVEEFEGEIVQEYYAACNMGKANSRFERIGTDAFLTFGEAQSAGIKKLDKAVVAVEKKRLRLQVRRQLFEDLKQGE